MISIIFVIFRTILFIFHIAKSSLVTMLLISNFIIRRCPLINFNLDFLKISLWDWLWTIFVQVALALKKYVNSIVYMYHGTLWEKARGGCSGRIALKQVYYQGWNRSPAQVGCMRQVLRAGAPGRPGGMGWGGRREGGSARGTHVNPWLIHVSVWQKPLQYCKVISLQLIKIKKKKVFKFYWWWVFFFLN